MSRNRDAVKRILKYISAYKGFVAGAVACAFLSVVTSLAGPLLIGLSIDSMFGRNAVNFNSIMRILIALAFIYVVNSLVIWLLTYLTNSISYRTVNAMRRDLFRKINTLPLKFYDRNPHGDTISRFVNDMDAIGDGMLQGISALLTGVFTISGTIGFMLYINPLMALVVILSAPVSFLVARFIATRSQQMFKEQAKSLGRLNGYVEEMIGGQKVVQSFSFEQHSFRQFSSINSELHKAGIKAQFYSSLTNPATRIVNNITYAITGIIGSVNAILGNITVGDISSFLIYSNLFSKPFNEITGVLTQIQAAAASARRIFGIMDMECEKTDGPEAVQIKHPTGALGFEEVFFAYDPKNPLIKNFNLSVKPGSRIAIVGKSGAGKTTLVNLLMRFYDVDSGKICVDGTAIDNITRTSLRRCFGMVLQDTWLFEGSIRDNIAYGRPEAGEQEIIDAAKAAGAHSFIKRLHNGYDTLITSAGENLSQGQKQLLTIARVMLVNPPMLILDEATSSIDTMTEIRIQKAFLKMIEGRTSFVIAHRLSTIRESDLILVMDQGNIVESGTHDELLKRGGHYAKLYSSQFEKA